MCVISFDWADAGASSAIRPRHPATLAGERCATVENLRRKTKVRVRIRIYVVCICIFVFFQLMRTFISIFNWAELPECDRRRCEHFRRGHKHYGCGAAFTGRVQGLMAILWAVLWCSFSAQPNWHALSGDQSDNKSTQNLMRMFMTAIIAVRTRFDTDYSSDGWNAESLMEIIKYIMLTRQHGRL